MQPIRRALISVSDKSGLLDFVGVLAARGVEILSTGGTARLLADHGLTVVEVSDHTGFPEMMDGRLKTLHPRIHGGILGRRGIDDAVMEHHGIPPIDLVVVNLYPFAQTVADPSCTIETAIEQIDIGGPALLRAAAKNHRDVAVVVDPVDYPRLAAEIQATGAVSDATRFELALKVFEHTARYDGAIANYLARQLEPDQRFPRTLHLHLRRQQTLRYGENPHQAAAVYVDQPLKAIGVTTAHQLQGKELSYNNIADADAALACVKQFDESAACVIVKHANPCGVALADRLESAYERAYRTDPESAFGGIIAFNRPLDEETASAIIERQFVEVIIAPRVEEGARLALAAKPNIRVLECGDWRHEPQERLDLKAIAGGLLVQDADLQLIDALRTVTQRAPTEEELADLLFAWRVAKFVKSNAIVYARDRMTLGIGAGQMSRVNAARIAVIKAEQAGLALKGAVMASDAFFPFRDGIDQAAAVGIQAVIQPGGSLRDPEVIAAANEHGLAMVFTGMRHFRH